MPVSMTLVALLAAEGRDLVFQCSDCGASVVAPIHKVLQRFGPEATLDHVRAPAVCKHCGCIEVEVAPVSLTAA